MSEYPNEKQKKQPKELPKEYKKRTGLRQKADYSSKFRCRTLICVLENPKNLTNIGAVLRNIDTLGISKLYVVDGHNVLPKNWQDMRTNKHLNCVSSSAVKWAYVRRFETTTQCFNHLKRKHYHSVVTSPHKSELIQNTYLSDGCFTTHHLAVWFGNETHGISEEAIQKSEQCIQIETCGIVESMNLAVSTGIVMYFIAQQRHHYVKKIKESKKTLESSLGQKAHTNIEAKRE